MTALYQLANEDLLKMEEVTQLSIGLVFTHLAFLKDLSYKRQQALNNRIA